MGTVSVGKPPASVHPEEQPVFQPLPRQPVEQRRPPPLIAFQRQDKDRPRSAMAIACHAAHPPTGAMTPSFRSTAGCDDAAAISVSSVVGAELSNTRNPAIFCRKSCRAKPAYFYGCRTGSTIWGGARPLMQAVQIGGLVPVIRLGAGARAVRVPHALPTQDIHDLCEGRGLITTGGIFHPLSPPMVRGNPWPVLTFAPFALL